MPAPTPELTNIMGPEILPFERRGFDRDVLNGEDVLFIDCYDATDNGKPENVILVNPDQIEITPKIGRYLWVIDRSGLKIILEATPNPNAERKIVCHTNITGGLPALQGGELWFGANGIIYINFRSGRYGATKKDQELAVLEYFNLVGYKQVKEVE